MYVFVCMFVCGAAQIRQYEEALHVLRELSTEEPHNLQATCRLVRLAQSVASWEDFEPRIAPMMKGGPAVRTHWAPQPAVCEAHTCGGSRQSLFVPEANAC